MKIFKIGDRVKFSNNYIHDQRNFGKLATVVGISRKEKYPIIIFDGYSKNSKYKYHPYYLNKVKNESLSDDKKDTK